MSYFIWPAVLIKRTAGEREMNLNHGALLSHGLWFMVMVMVMVMFAFGD
jgi:hypothetical protein